MFGRWRRIGLVALSILLGVGCSQAQTEVAQTPLLNGSATVEASEVPLSFPSGDLTLKGLLTLPQRAVSNKVPAVVLISGSGPSSADGAVPGQLAMTFGFTIPIYKEIAIGLRELGVATLRYDKRSCGPFNNCAENDYPLPPADLSIVEFARDALAAVEALKARPEIDADRIWVLGHSQGGTLLPWILTEDQSLAGGIFVAAPFAPIDVILEMQARHTREVLLTMGVGETQANSMVADLEKVAEDVKELRTREPSMNLVMGASELFWKSWIDFSDGVPGLVSKLDCPLFFLGGEYDWNVPISELEAWEAHLEEHPGPSVRDFVSLPCLTHALNCVSESDFMRIRPEHIGKHVSSDFVSQLGSFVKQN